jgi:NinB protein
MKKIFVLREPVQAHKVLIEQIWPFIKPMLIAGHVLKVTIGDITRTLEQNSLFHSICEDIAKAGFVWHGKKRNAEQVKVLLVSGHAIATGEGAEVVAGLEGEFINLRESTALMSVKRSSSLIEYATAWATLNGYKLND